MALATICKSFGRISFGTHKWVSKRQFFPIAGSTTVKFSSSDARARALTQPSEIKQEVVVDSTEAENKLTRDVISRVNEQIETSKHGRLFAVVHLCGKQFKVTDEDIILVEGYWPPAVGDRIRLEKVMLVGGADFTLIGRPLLSPNLVNVEATVIEKTLSHTKTHFRKIRRKQYMRINFYRSPFTMLRINCITLEEKLHH
ncbi:39S ribosomal protein L21, mitochondrial [Schistocerca americana]|uniref:39S ribosomal protein L21, mitochondrial n=1 Tax=Schistocerca americana TaxID=7009 RepID=UPI001F4F3A36|nr:39S ribosomal protein L21, mitochondrial [Schistocerca americana]